MKYTYLLNFLFFWLIGFISCNKNIEQITTYDARIEGREILTPIPSNAPKINSPNLYGCTADKPFIYRIPTQGKRPIQFECENLPGSLELNAKKGIIVGKSLIEDGAYTIRINAKNEHGQDSKALTIVVGEDKIALTPPMGWNHWYTHYQHIKEKHIRNATDAMVKSGMADVGYSYISIDDCWMRITSDNAKMAIKRKKFANFTLDTLSKVAAPRNENGRIIPNSEFSDMKALTDYIHNYGLKAGIYSSPGPRTCQEFEGSWQHEKIDAHTYAEWGFDFLKYDWCRYSEIFNALPDSANEQYEYIKPYAKMYNILKEVDRDILFNLCQYGKGDVWNWGDSVGHSWRISSDLGPKVVEGGVYVAAKQTLEIGEYNGPGSWNDPDYLIMGKWRHPHKLDQELSKIPLTPNEQYSYFSLWCMMASPLIFSGDMAALDPFLVNVLTNTEMIAMNQDPLGKCASVVSMTDSAWILKKPMFDGSIVVGLFDVANQGDQEISIKWSDFDIEDNYLIRDLWRQKDIGRCDDNLTVKIGPQGCAILRLKS